MLIIPTEFTNVCFISFKKITLKHVKHKFKRGHIMAAFIISLIFKIKENPSIMRLEQLLSTVNLVSTCTL